MDSGDPREPRRATRADVARLAGVSPALVSYALNGGPRKVAAETARRIHEAVAQLGYSPNAAARALNLGVIETMGLIIHDITNPYYNSIAATVQRAAEQHGVSLITASTLEDRSKTLSHLEAMDARQLRGVIVTTHMFPEAVRAATRMRTRIVQLDSLDPIPGAPRFDMDFEAGSWLALDHLTGLGHRRIAFVGGQSPVDVRIGPWRESHRRRGVDPGPFRVVPYTREGGYEGMRGILADEIPTSVFAGSDLIAMGVLRALREAGLRVPEDVSVVGYDDIPESEFAAPPLTTVRVPIEQMAADAVAAVLDPTAFADGDHLSAPALIVRASTAAPRR